jgi:DNA-directed RNA polymerase specialized sigma24 family protein
MQFPVTQWTLLAQASLNGDAEAQQSLEMFCERYRAPVVALLRRRGVMESRVEDLTHDFFIQLMKSSALKRADRSQGSFRNFLSAILSQFLADDVKRNHALKRGGGAAPLSLDAQDGAAAAEVSSANGDSDLYLDHDWALHLITRALDNVAAEWNRAGKAARFAVLRAFLPGAVEVITQQEAAVRLDMSDTALRSELQRLRESFRSSVRQEVAATVHSPAEVDGELQHLLAVLRAVPPVLKDSPPQPSGTVG